MGRCLVLTTDKSQMFETAGTEKAYQVWWALLAEPKPFGNLCGQGEEKNLDGVVLVAPCDHAGSGFSTDTNGVDCCIPMKKN